MIFPIEFALHAAEFGGFTPSESSQCAIVRSDSPAMHRSKISGIYLRPSSFGMSVLWPPSASATS